MNLKVVLNDYLDFLESKGIKFPNNYSYKMNDEMFAKMKLILEDVDYDFILEVIDEFYDALKQDIEEAKNNKVCVKFANRAVVGEIKKINYISPDKIGSIDLLDKRKESMNIRFQLIYSVEEPRRPEEIKKEKIQQPKKNPEKHIIKDKHKYDDFIEPDLLSKQVNIVDRPEYLEDLRPSLVEILFSKAAIITVICIALGIVAIYAVNTSIASTTISNPDDVVCIEGYTNVNGECLKVTKQANGETTTVVAETTTTQSDNKSTKSAAVSLYDAVRSIHEED